MSKGQIFVTDYILGISIFLLIFGACIFIWDRTIYTIQKDFMMREMVNSAYRSSEQLIRSSGISSNWEDNISSLKAVGLAIDDRILSAEKFDKIRDMDYDDLRHYLGIGKYDFYLKVENSTGAIIGETGKRPTGDIVANVRRIAVMDNKSVIVDMSVWGSLKKSDTYPIFHVEGWISGY